MQKKRDNDDVKFEKAEVMNFTPERLEGETFNRMVKTSAASDFCFKQPSADIKRGVRKK